MGEKAPGPPAAVWLIGRDEATPNYTVLYHDGRPVSRVYHMSFADGVWRIWRDTPGFSQRHEGNVSQDGWTISGHWENSSDGTHWQHDFDVNYSKAPSRTPESN